MDDRIRESLARLDHGEPGRADAAFLARARQERSRRRRPAVAIVASAAALAACAALAFVLSRPAPPTPTKTPRLAEQTRSPDAIAPGAATLAALMRLNSSANPDSLVLSRPDCVGWTLGVNPLGP